MNEYLQNFIIPLKRWKEKLHSRGNKDTVKDTYLQNLIFPPLF